MLLDKFIPFKEEKITQRRKEYEDELLCSPINNGKSQEIDFSNVTQVIH